MREEFDSLLEPDDRRKAPRFKTKAFLGIPIQLKPLPPFFGSMLQGQLVDLSAGGMSLIIGEKIPVETKLHLQLTFPDRSVLACNVRICRAHPHKGRNVIGIEFLDLADYLQAKLVRISKDFLTCETRIKDKAKEICRLDCSFFNLCDKLERIHATHELDVMFQMKLKPPAEEK